MMFGTREEFTYFLCEQCGCLQISETPTDLSQYYPSNYYSISQSDVTPRHRSLSKPRALLEKMRATTALFGKGYRLNRLASQFVDLPPEIYTVGSFIKACGIKSWHADFLDVGCGSHSWWLNSLQALGFTNLAGVDPNIESAMNDNGIRYHKAHIQDMSGQYDLISLHHSLEHIPNQLDVLVAVKKLLKPNGRCLIRVPLVSSLVWEMYGTDWVELDAPRHLYLHSVRSIETLCKQAGFRVMQTTWDSGPFQFFGSELYKRDIPLDSAKSFWKNPDNSDFTYSEMANFSALAVQANKDGRGGRGCFVIQPDT